MPRLPFRDNFSVTLTVASPIREHKLPLSYFGFLGFLLFFLRALGILHVQLLASLLTLVHHLQDLHDLFSIPKGYSSKFDEQLTRYMCLERGRMITL